MESYDNIFFNFAENKANTMFYGICNKFWEQKSKIFQHPNPI